MTQQKCHEHNGDGGRREGVVGCIVLLAFQLRQVTQTQEGGELLPLVIMFFNVLVMFVVLH